MSEVSESESLKDAIEQVFALDLESFTIIPEHHVEETRMAVPTDHEEVLAQEEAAPPAADMIENDHDRDYSPSFVSITEPNSPIVLPKGLEMEVHNEHRDYSTDNSVTSDAPSLEDATLTIDEETVVVKPSAKGDVIVIQTTTVQPITVPAEEITTPKPATESHVTTGSFSLPPSPTFRKISAPAVFVPVAQSPVEVFPEKPAGPTFKAPTPSAPAPSKSPEPINIFFPVMQSHLVQTFSDDRPNFIPFRVPRLGEEYDMSGFWDYPARAGWRVHRFDRRCHAGRCPPGVCIVTDAGEPYHYGMHTPSISRADSRGAAPTTCSEKLAFLQTWLFFGALAEAHVVCNLSINPDDFFAKFFDTARLNGLPARLYLATQASGCAGSKVLREKLYSIIRQIQLMLTRASDWEDEHEYTQTQCEVLFSIQILLRTLSLALLYHYDSPFPDSEDDLKLSFADPAADWRPEGQMSMMSFTHARLIESGWCKSELWNILQSFDVSAAACYLSRPHAIHNHVNCTDTICMAYQTDETSYRTLHIDDNCECAFVSVEPAHLRSALAENAIPKIVVSDELQLSMVYGDDLDYVAFSHVWADGLGNPFQNALPSCQIRRLRDLATNLYNRFNLGKRKAKVAIWIDTLCIPVAPDLKEFRKLAIRLLARTYTEATGVLVLDRELCHFEASKASILEVSIRLMCSGWLKRLWTLQEASLAGEVEGTGTLYIQMMDGPAHWNRLTRCFEYKPSRLVTPPPKPSSLAVSLQEVKIDLEYGMHLLTAMESRLPSVRAIREPLFETRFQKIMSAVQNRSTSKREDEPVCMASLLGLDLREILNTNDADERMMKFYRLLYEIPTAIIFAEFGVPDFPSRNLTAAPYRWAPRSLSSLDRPMEINLAFSAMRFADPPLPLLGRCEDDGLHIQHPGFVLSDTKSVMFARQSLLLDTNGGELYSLSLALSDTSPQSIGPVGRCALIFKTEICSDVVIVKVLSETRAAIEAEVVFCVEILGHGTVKPCTEKHGNAELQPLYGRSTEMNQRWCIT